MNKHLNTNQMCLKVSVPEPFRDSKGSGALPHMFNGRTDNSPARMPNSFTVLVIFADSVPRYTSPWMSSLVSSCLDCLERMVFHASPRHLIYFENLYIMKLIFNIYNYNSVLLSVFSTFERAHPGFHHYVGHLSLIFFALKYSSIS